MIARLLPYRRSLLAWVFFFLFIPILLFPSINVLLTSAALLALIPFWVLLLRTAKPEQDASPLSLPLLLWLVLIFLGISVSADPALTLEKACGLLLSVTAVFLYHQTLASHIEWYSALVVSTGIAFCFVLVGLLNVNWLAKISTLDQLVRLIPVQLIPIPDGTESVSANQLAGTTLFLFAPALSFAIFWPQTNRHPVRTLLTLLPLSFTGSILLLSQSRTGYLAVAGLFFLTILLWALFTLKIIPHADGTVLPLYSSLPRVSLASPLSARATWPMRFTIPHQKRLSARWPQSTFAMKSGFGELKRWEIFRSPGWDLERFGKLRAGSILWPLILITISPMRTTSFCKRHWMWGFPA
jgi:hypothetical protein